MNIGSAEIDRNPIKLLRVDPSSQSVPAFENDMLNPCHGELQRSSNSGYACANYNHFPDLLH
jgi:hypothetical protein